jgi:hypothetical protein
MVLAYLILIEVITHLAFYFLLAKGLLAEAQ